MKKSSAIGLWNELCLKDLRLLAISHDLPRNLWGITQGREDIPFSKEVHKKVYDWLHKWADAIVEGDS